MRAAFIVLIALAAVDIVTVGLLLALVWAVHCRQRRLADAAGGPIPPAATGQFLFLAAVGLAGILVLYAVAALFLDE